MRLLSEIFPNVRIIQRNIIMNVHRSSCNALVILSDLNQT